MADTIPIQIRWPRALAVQVRQIARRRHSTLSEVTRQAVIDQFSLGESDHISDKSDTEEFTPGSV